MAGTSEDRLRGASADAIRRARETGDSLFGTPGFAGRLDGELVRDVLGRQPLFREADAADPTADGAWAFDRTDLTDPASVPAGHAVDGDGTRQVWSLPSPEPRTDPAAGVDGLRSAVDDAVAATLTDAVTAGPADAVPAATTDDPVAAPSGDFAVAFSGGVDSAVLAALTDAPLYVTGFPDSHDVAAARSAAAAMDREVTVVGLDHDRLAAAVPRVVAATGRDNAMDVSIALPLLLTAERVAGDGYDALVVGQGADELFGGYAKVAKAPEDPRVDADTVAGARREVLEGLPDQLERDVLAIRSAGVEPVAPYLHDDVVAAALELPSDALVTEDGVRKWALRKAAREWLPDEVVERDKKAMQYGSLVSRELDRLARQAGFKRRMDDHVGKYVDSLCAGTD